MRAATEGMSDEDVVDWLIAFEAYWSLDQQSPGRQNTSWHDDNDLPGYFNNIGYGLCGGHASIFLQLAWLTGRWYLEDEIDLRTVPLNGHILAEIRVMGRWWTIDPQQMTVYRDSGSQTALRAAELLARPELIWQYADQFAGSLGGTRFQPVFDALTATDAIDDYAGEINNRVGEGGLTLQPGDRLTMYPLGFSQRWCVNCLDDPRDETHAMFTIDRRIDLRNGFATEFPGPYAPVGLMIDNPGSSAADVTATVRGHLDKRSLTALIPAGGSADFNTLFSPSNYDAVGNIENLTVTVSDGTGELAVQAMFGFPPRSIPQLDHDRRTLRWESDGAGTVEIVVESLDEVLPVNRVVFDHGKAGMLDVKADGRALARLVALVNTDGGVPAGGHRVEVVADNPAVDVVVSPRAGQHVIWPVVSAWTAHARRVGALDIQPMVWYARSSEAVGPVTFTLLIDGEAAKTVVVDFQ
ncbi:MAG: hypothetical protein M5R36_13245 [Deltaproteobacteria bacterium]|nr:hypothetical protein [Deltaproteobacteria bacterium]